jgi:phosphohistidine phosphatase
MKPERKTEAEKKNVNLYVLRHGKAGKRVETAAEDAERALTSPGRKEVKAVAKSLSAAGIKFDHIISSPLKRAEETAEIISEAYDGLEPENWDELKPEGSRTDLYRKLSKLDSGNNILVVGHEPYLSSMIGDLISGGTDNHIVLKKAGVAKVRITSLNPRFSGELLWLLTPKQIKRMS